MAYSRKNSILKKKSILMLVISLCLILSGCKKEESSMLENVQNQNSQNTDVSQNQTQPEQETEITEAISPTDNSNNTTPEIEDAKNIITNVSESIDVNIEDKDIKKFSSEIAITYDSEESPFDNLIFSENYQDAFIKNNETLTNGLTNYISGEVSEIDYNGEKVNVNIFKNPVSKIEDSVYYVQNQNMIGLSFSGTANFQTTESDIENYTDQIRELTSVFVSDIDLYDDISSLIDNFDYYERNTNDRVVSTIYGSDNTIFVSVTLEAYKKNEVVYVDFSTNIMLHNNDLKYVNGTRVDFYLRDIKLTNENAIVGNVIGYNPEGKKLTALMVCGNLVNESNLDSDTINIKESLGDKYIPETKETEAGLAYDFSSLKGKFDLETFTPTSDSKYVTATDSYGFSECNIPVTDGLYNISVNLKNSSFFTNEDGIKLFIDEVYFFTGYKLPEESIRILQSSVREGFTKLEFKVYLNAKETEYSAFAEYLQDGSVRLTFKETE